MKVPRGQRIWLALLLLVNVVLWVVPSDVVELIARDRHTLLGRYSRTHFFWIIAMAIVFLVNLYTDLAVGAVRRRRQFQVFAVLLTGIPSVGMLDFVLRNPQRAHSHYVRDHVAYRRPANVTFSVDTVDEPEASRTYPSAPPGYPTVTCTYRTDRRGYRNQTDLQAYDVVALGDSFAEGSRVSDDHAWPVRLAKRSGLSVYNLGMSGYDPLKYAASLARFGLDLQPRYVLCMLYEGNDFRSAASDSSRTKSSFSKRFKTYTKQSPILTALDRLIVNTFSPINATSPIKGVEVLDWLPLAIPRDGNTHYYAFAPKQLGDLYQDAEAFERGPHWRSVRNQLIWMRDECRKKAIHFVVVYAPSKAHVVLPAIADRLPAEKVARFTAISYDEGLPRPDIFLENLMKNIDTREMIVRRWCADEGVAFVSLTGALREAAVAGTQVYYTYDQHWTPDGHRIVAEVIADSLAETPKQPRSSAEGA